MQRELGHPDEPKFLTDHNILYLATYGKSNPSFNTLAKFCNIRNVKHASAVERVLFSSQIQYIRCGVFYDIRKNFLLEITVKTYQGVLSTTVEWDLPYHTVISRSPEVFFAREYVGI